MDDGQRILDTTGMVHSRVFSYYQDLCREKKEERQLKRRYERATLGGDRSRESEGDLIVARIRYLLEYGFHDDRGKRIIRSKEQRQIHETYIRCNLPKIYQRDWEDNQERILQKFGLTKLAQEALVVMPRRSGKTWSMAMFCAVMMVCVSDIEVSIFATGQRTASKLLKLIDKMLRKLFMCIKADDFKVLQKNKESITLIGPDGTERICGCYPGTVTVRSFLSLSISLSL